jgi:hypothetical protein
MVLGSVKDGRFPPGLRQSQESVSGLIYVNELRNSTGWRDCRVRPRMRYGNIYIRNNRRFPADPALAS